MSLVKIIDNWCKENNYLLDTLDDNDSFTFIRVVSNVEKNIKKMMCVMIDKTSDYKKVTGGVDVRGSFTIREQLDKIYIELNRVKDDTKNFEEYLKEQKVI